MFRVFKQVPKILFGKGAINRLKELIPAENLSDILYIIDDSLVDLPDIFDKRDNGIISFPASLGEPNTSQIDQICEKRRTEDPELPTAIIGVGGGSTMDVAKAISVMINNKGSSAQYQGARERRSPHLTT